MKPSFELPLTGRHARADADQVSTDRSQDRESDGLNRTAAHAFSVR
jgi:hypothetical protein